jgi:hypothetical protein
MAVAAENVLPDRVERDEEDVVGRDALPARREYDERQRGA